MQCAAMSTQRIERERHRLELLEQRTRSLDPALMLRRGYSITTVEGVALRDPSQVRPGDLLLTQLEKGTLKSKVI